MLIKMIDGGFTKYWDDAMYYSGCETCDYGSEYIQFITITLTKYEIEIELNRMYEYAFSQADAITLFCENYEKISHFISGSDNYCHPDNNIFCTSDECKHCALKWLTQEHPNPMPELKAGMFVEADNGFGACVGIITVDDDDNMIVVYFTTGWDFIKNVTINKIYKAGCHCPDDCNIYNTIWEKS